MKKVIMFVGLLLSLYNVAFAKEDTMTFEEIIVRDVYMEDDGMHVRSIKPLQIFLEKMTGELTIAFNNPMLGEVDINISENEESVYFNQVYARIGKLVIDLSGRTDGNYTIEVKNGDKYCWIGNFSL